MHDLNRQYMVSIVFSHLLSLFREDLHQSLRAVVLLDCHICSSDVSQWAQSVVVGSDHSQSGCRQWLQPGAAVSGVQSVICRQGSAHLSWWRLTTRCAIDLDLHTHTHIIHTENTHVNTQNMHAHTHTHNANTHVNTHTANTHAHTLLLHWRTTSDISHPF